MAEWSNIEEWRTAAAPPRTWRARIDALVDAEAQRCFLWLPVMFGVGIALYIAQPREAPMLLLIALAAAMLVAHRFIASDLLRRVSAAIVAVTLGAAIAAVRTEVARAPSLERSTAAVALTGWIERVEPRVGRGHRVTLRIASLSGIERGQWPSRVRVRLRDDDAGLQPGQAVQVRARLNPPPMPVAPDDFDFGRLAYFSGLGGFGSALGRMEPVEIAQARPWSLAWATPIETLRQAIRARIVAALPGETGEIATALITGERGGISEATNQAYRNSGLFHILSISGLHMVIMAGAVFYVLRLLLAAIPTLALNHHIKAWAAGGALLAAFGYLLLSGAAFATVRAFVMIAIMFTAIMLDRPALTLRNVALAALAILVVYPESLFDAGFQMSFAAVVGLVSTYEWLRQRRKARDLGRDVPAGPLRSGARFFGQIIGSTIVASLVVAPFGIYHFHNTQLLSIMANVVAIPVCNLLVMPAALAVLIAMPLGLETVPLWLMGQGIDAMTTVAQAVGALPGAIAKIPAIPTLAFALIVSGGLWLLLWSQAWRWLGTIPIAAGIALASTLPRPDVLIGRDGTLVGVRMADGRLSALAVRASTFDLGRWLELDGDRRTSDEVADARAFRCDAVACSATVGGRHVSVVLSAAALREDCARADIIVARVRVPQGCGDQARAGQLLIDPADTAARGSHALYLTPTGVRVVTVAAARGQRAWSSRIIPDSEPSNRVTGFTALFERFR